MANGEFLFVQLAFAMFCAVLCYKLESEVYSGKECQRSTRNTTELIRSLINDTSVVPECGPGKWLQIANFNLTDSHQTCPLPWNTTSPPLKSCITAMPPCSSVYYGIHGVAYQKVCGMATGNMSDTVDAFYRFVGNGTIDEAYLEGVSITHGYPRQHIWSLAAGHGLRGPHPYRYPCDSTNSSFAVLPPQFVGNNYFCDGDYNGVLWDGKDCTLPSGCCSFNSPPWFSTTLPYATLDQIEVRICQDQGHDNEGVFLTTLSLYVQ